MLATVKPGNAPAPGAWLAGEVWRSCDRDELNGLVNHPDVLPGVCIGEPAELDLSPLVADPFNIFFVGAHGGAAFIWRGPGIYEGHSFILPAGRGKWALSACGRMLDELFNQGVAHMVWGETPFANRAARAFNRRLGFGSCGVFTKPRAVGCQPEPVEAFVLWRDEWTARRLQAATGSESGVNSGH